jgi:hypothetical protein
VLLTFADYKKLKGEKSNIADLLAMPGEADIDQYLPRSRELAASADLN